jgi:hypothetical protein
MSPPRSGKRSKRPRGNVTLATAAYNNAFHFSTDAELIGKNAEALQLEQQHFNELWARLILLAHQPPSPHRTGNEPTDRTQADLSPAINKARLGP